MWGAGAPFSSNSKVRSSPSPTSRWDAAVEADAVLLEAVAEPRLRHAHALLELEGEPVEVVEEIGVELLDEAATMPPSSSPPKPEPG